MFFSSVCVCVVGGRVIEEDCREDHGKSPNLSTMFYTEIIY